MFELIVEDIVTITGRGTIFCGKVRSGIISVGDPVVCKTRTRQVETRVIGLQEMKSGHNLQTAETGRDVGVVCKKVDHDSIADAWEKDGEFTVVVGVTLVKGEKKPWWKF